MGFGAVIGLGVGAFFVFKVFSILYVKLFDISLLDNSALSQVLSIADFKPMIEHYGSVFGFLIIGIFGPIYEEIAFRGVILTVCKKYLGFNWANVIQALLFALIHGSLSLLPVFFVFGFMGGYLVKKSNSLLPGIIFHIINNVLAFWVFSYLMDRF